MQIYNIKVKRFSLITGSNNVAYFSWFQLVAHPFFRSGDVRGLKKFNPGPVSVKSLAPFFFSLYNVIEHFLLFIISGTLWFKCEAASETIPEWWRKKTKVNEQCGACIKAIFFNAGAVYLTTILRQMQVSSMRWVSVFKGERVGVKLTSGARPRHFFFFSVFLPSFLLFRT